MIDKKVVIGIVIFILCGLFIYSFANPLNEEEYITPTNPVGGVDSEESEENKVEENTEQTDDSEQVENSEENGVEENTNTTQNATESKPSNTGSTTTVVTRPSQNVGNQSSSSSNGTITTKPNESTGSTTTKPNQSTGNTATKPNESTESTTTKPSENTGSTTTKPSENTGSTTTKPSESTGGTTTKPSENTGSTTTKPEETPVVPRPTATNFTIASDEDANVQVIVEGNTITYRGEMYEKLETINGRTDYIKMLVMAPDVISDEEFSNLKLIYQGKTYDSSEFYKDTATGKAYFKLYQMFNRVNDGSGSENNFTTREISIYWGYGEMQTYKLIFDIVVNERVTE